MSGKIRILSASWFIAPAHGIEDTCPKITSETLKDVPWLPAKVPGTILSTLVANDVYDNLYQGQNLARIAREQFEIPWWYRTEFNISDAELKHQVRLECDGINYRASIWINGLQIADKAHTFGTYRRFQFDITGHVHSGENTLTALIQGPRPGEFSTGFVDWNPPPPDGNMGLFRPVKLRFIDKISLEHPFVTSRVKRSSPDEAELTVSCFLFNHSEDEVAGVLSGQIDDIAFNQRVTLSPFDSREIRFTPEQFHQLRIIRPRLWWPNNLGAPELYRLALSFTLPAGGGDSTEIQFGIREVADYVNDSGHRGFSINGRKVVIKSAGWTDDLLLQDTRESLEAQIQYVRHMNLNCIRLEGFWGKDHTLYDLCDRYGILIMVGWSCHWEHAEYLGKHVDNRFGGVVSDADIELVSRMWQDQVLWLRHHPSIFVWTVASDKVPKTELELKYLETFRKYDRSRPYLNSTGGIGSEQGIITDSLIISEVSGSSRVKMLGPYAYTPPVYWYTDKKFGGAYGFNTETGPGVQVPHLESIKKFIPAENLWPIDFVWNFHCGLNEFSDLDRFCIAMRERYGEPDSLQAFSIKAQTMNYELMRPMFEAFQCNKGRATGIVQWMLNAAWPKMYWQLYDWYLMPNAAFYATRKACEPLHLLYNYGDKSVYCVNDYPYPVTGLQARIRIFDNLSQLISDNTVAFDSPPDISMKIFELPERSYSTIYFLDLRLMVPKSGDHDANFYWLSTKPDILDYDTKLTPWQYYTPTLAYADYTLLNALPEMELSMANIEVSKTVGSGKRFAVTVQNRGNHIAFLIELQLADRITGEIFLPVFWSDNYISLLPGEIRTIQAENEMDTSRAVLSVGGWNTKIKHFQL